MLNAIEEIIDKGNILGSVQVSQIANYELDNSLIKSKAHELFDDPLIKLVVRCYIFLPKKINIISRMHVFFAFWNRLKLSYHCYTVYMI